MKSKGVEKETACELRRLGHSLNEICKILHISKSSASLWVRNVDLTDSARRRIESKRKEARERAASTNRYKVDKKFIEAQTYGQTVLEKALMNDDALRTLCAIMYWCEGTKIRRSQIMSFANSDPGLMRSFLDLLRNGFPIEESKLRLTIHVHEYHDQEAQLRFWSKLTKIPLSQCHRPYLKPHTAIRKRDGYQGCASVRYLDVDFGRRLEGIAKAFIDRAYS